MVAPEPTPTPVTLGPPQYRGLWADAFHEGFKSQAQAERLLQDAQRANVNALFIQVRKAGDAYYNDSFEPRAGDIQGPPRFDPLAFLIKRAHSANPRLEVHAWVNVFYVGRSSAVWQRNPDWVNRTSGGTAGPYLDPAALARRPIPVRSSCTWPRRTTSMGSTSTSCATRRAGTGATAHRRCRPTARAHPIPQIRPGASGAETR